MTSGSSCLLAIKLVDPRSAAGRWLRDSLLFLPAAPLTFRLVWPGLVWLYQHTGAIPATTTLFYFSHSSIHSILIVGFVQRGMHTGRKKTTAVDRQTKILSQNERLGRVLIILTTQATQPSAWFCLSCFFVFFPFSLPRALILFILFLSHVQSGLVDLVRS